MFTSLYFVREYVLTLIWEHILNRCLAVYRNVNEQLFSPLSHVNARILLMMGSSIFKCFYSLCKG